MIERTVLLTRIALRNVRRQARRSLLTASAMVLGVGLLMFVRSWEAGAHVMYVESATRLGSGHVTLVHPDYVGSRDVVDRIPARALALAEARVAEVVPAGELRGVLPRVTVGGLGQSAASSIPLRINGVDPERERGISLLEGSLEEGRYLEPGDRLEAVVGAGVAERLRVELGSRIVLMAQGDSGELESQLVLVTGIFRTAIPEIDRGLVEIPLETARSWLGIGSDATGLNVVLASDQRTAEVARNLEEALLEAGIETRRGRDDRVVAVQPWWEAMPDLHAGLQADTVQTYVMLLVLLAVVALAVVNSVLMSVLGRTRELGVLRALGLDRTSVGATVMLEGTLLAAVSGVLGMGLGLFISLVLLRDGIDLRVLLGEADLAFAGAIIEPVVQPVVLAGDVVAILAIVMSIGILASLYPAWQAAHVDPAEAMKSDD